MTAPALTVTPDRRVDHVANLLLERGISAVPVVDREGRLAGIVSEGDLVGRRADGRQRRPWWLEMLSSAEERARDYLRPRGATAGDVMTREVVTVGEHTPLPEIAALLEKHRIKRVPVVREAKVVGIVSRANLLHGLAASPAVDSVPQEDRELRERVLAELGKAGVATSSVNPIVRSGVVELWGAASSEAELRAARLAARNAAPRQRIEDHLSALPAPGDRITMWE